MGARFYFCRFSDEVTADANDVKFRQWNGRDRSLYFEPRKVRETEGTKAEVLQQINVYYTSIATTRNVGPVYTIQGTWDSS